MIMVIARPTNPKQNAKSDPVPTLQLSYGGQFLAESRRGKLSLYRREGTQDWKSLCSVRDVLFLP